MAQERKPVRRVPGDEGIGDVEAPRLASAGDEDAHVRGRHLALLDRVAQLPGHGEQLGGVLPQSRDEHGDRILVDRHPEAAGVGLDGVGPCPLGARRRAVDRHGPRERGECREHRSPPHPAGVPRNQCEVGVGVAVP